MLQDKDPVHLGKTGHSKIHPVPPDCIKVGSVNDVLEIEEAFHLRPSPVHLKGGLGGSCNFATRGISGSPQQGSTRQNIHYMSEHATGLDSPGG